LALATHAAVAATLIALVATTILILILVTIALTFLIVCHSLIFWLRNKKFRLSFDELVYQAYVGSTVFSCLPEYTFDGKKQKKLCRENEPFLKNSLITLQ
jgi:hypothetical protein